VKTACPDAAPGDAGSPFVVTAERLPGLRLEDRREQLRDRLRVHLQHGFLRCDQLLGDEVGRDHDGRVARALAVAGLQHVQAVVLDRELEVLDVLVVLLEPRRDLAQLLVGLWQHLLEFAIGCGVRTPDTTSSPCALTRNSP
jgi:hypothetical protein